MNKTYRAFFILWDDWTWWTWTVTAVLLLVGLLWQPVCLLAATLLTAAQAMLILIRENSLSAFAVQLRVAYLVLLGICFLPHMHWLFWLPTVGTFALVIFGYCLLARMLSLMPGIREEPYSFDLLRRTFFSRPDLARVSEESSGCPGGLCTIDAQVARSSDMTEALSVSTDTESE